MEHPSQDVLRRFLLGAASRPESHLVVRHLLSRCPVCAATLKALKRRPPDPAFYEPALERFAARLRGLERNPANGPGGGEGVLRRPSAFSANATPRRGSG